MICSARVGRPRLCGEAPGPWAARDEGEEPREREERLAAPRYAVHDVDGRVGAEVISDEATRQRGREPIPILEPEPFDGWVVRGSAVRLGVERAQTVSYRTADDKSGAPEARPRSRNSKPCNEAARGARVGVTGCADRCR